MNKVLKAVLPKSYTLNTMEKPMQAGEIFHLWESLNAGNELVSITETFIMNMKDNQLQKVLKDLLADSEKIRLQRVGSLLKDAGFTIAPRPASKTLQGKPGVGQEVLLSDEEVIRVMGDYVVGLLELDGRGIGVVTTNKRISDVFMNLLSNDIKYHELILNLSVERKSIETPPAATSAPDSLNMGEVQWLWTELEYRHSAAMQLATMWNNTKDPEIAEEILYGMNKITIPQLKKIEEILKREGFTVPSRPADRMIQQTPDKTNKIIMNDAEILALLLSSTQIAVNNHIRAYIGAVRDDIKKLFKDFLSIEIDNMDRIFKLSIKRSTLVKPPFVTSKRG